MPDNTFDVVSKIEIPEVVNAIQQALKEIHQRYDLKDSKSNIELNEKDNKVVLSSQDEFKLKAVVDLLESKLVRRRCRLRIDLRRDHSGRRLLRAPGDLAAAGHPHRKSARDREED